MTTPLAIYIDTAEADATTAAYLRALADVMDPQPNPPSDPPTESAPAPRFVEVIDRSGDHGIHDKERDLTVDLMTRPDGALHASIRHEHLIAQLAKLNAGTLRPEDVTYNAQDDSDTVTWQTPEALYPPYQEVTA